MKTISQLKPAARRHLNNLGDELFWRLSRRELHRLLSRFPDGHPESIYRIFHDYTGKGWYRRIGATQIEEEFRALIAEVQKIGPAVVVEIGTARGGSFLAWCRNASELAISIDLPGGIHGGGYAVQRGRLYAEFARGRTTRAVLLREDSHSDQTVQKVRSILAGRPIDFLFIDGDHRYAGVSRDYALWKGLVRPGGLIGFHDVVHHPERTSIDVHRFWAELKESRSHKEFVANPADGYGIGVVYA